MKRSALIFFLFLCISGCRTFHDNSETKHDFGVTARPPDDDAKPCKWDSTQSINIEADRYLNDLKDYIAKANSQTFDGWLLPENICIYLTNDAGIGGSKAGPRKIEIRKNTLDIARTDAEVATILSHELAHITMQSSHQSFPAKLLAHPDWPKIYQETQDSQQNAENRLRELWKQPDGMLQIHQVETKWRHQLTRQVLEDISKAPASFHDLDCHIKASSISLHQKEELYAKLPPKIPGVTGSLDKPEESWLCLGYKTTDLSRDELSGLVSKFHNTFDSKIQKFRVSVEPVDLKIWDDSVALLAQQNRAVRQVRDESETSRRKFDDFVKSTLGNGATLYNWNEIEADEVGFEFYLRSGFNHESMTAMIRHLIGEQAYQECIENHVKKGIIPNAGSQTHPEWCWRIYDILVIEAKIHESEYQLLYKTAIKDEVLPGRLQKLK